MARPLIYSDGPGYVRKEGPEYRFYLIIHELYERSARAKDFVSLMYNFGTLLGEKAALTLPTEGEYADIRKRLFELPWNDSTKKHLQTYQHPVLILSRTELSLNDFDEKGIRIFFFTDALSDPDSYFPVLQGLAEEVNNGGNLFELNPFLGRPIHTPTGFFQRLWDAILLKPSFFGIGIDLKALVPPREPKEQAPPITK